MLFHEGFVVCYAKPIPIPQRKEAFAQAKAMVIYMDSVRIVSLYSGSSGNATLIETPSGSILIDAGKSARSLTNALKQAGSDPSKILAVFVTHEHTDHTSALEVFLKKNRVPVHMTEISAKGLHSPEGSKLREAICPHTPVYSVHVADMTVTSFPVSHDSAYCVGYRVETDGGYKFGYATDTGYVTDGMKAMLDGCDSVVLESNHNVELLKCGSYPPDTKKRILSRLGHLSNDDCAGFLHSLAEHGTKNFMLAHLSAENNRPELALDSAKHALEDFPEAKVFIAKPDTETVFVD